MYKAFKYRLKPTPEQETVLTQWMGAGRWLWNWCLDKNKDHYDETKKFIFRFDLNVHIPHLKKEHPWLKDVPSQALQNRVMDFDIALRRSFKGANNRAGFPTHRSKYKEHHNTLRISQTNKHIIPGKNQIKIPKLDPIKWIKHRPLEGRLINATIKKENNLWWCICLCEIDGIMPIDQAPESQVVGVDLGLKEFAVLSDDTRFETPKLYRKQQKKLRRKQRKLARRKKGSKNREKARKKLNKTHYKIKCQRRDFTHKASSAVTKDYAFIAVEDLNIKGMTKNRRLSKSISDQGWAMFVYQLAYKSVLNGGNLVKIGRFEPSSKTCSSCGHIQDMPLQIRTYNCESCDMTLDRDLNAAINIKKWGIDEINRAGTARIYACGDTSIGDQVRNWSRYVSEKQENFLAIGKEAATSLESQ